MAGGLRRYIAAMALPVIMSVMPGCVRSLNDTSAYVMLPEDGWPYGEMVTFNLTHLDSVSEGEIIVAVSHDQSYRYSNLWLEISSVESDNRIVRDTIEFEVADSAGHWRGTGITPEIGLEMPVRRLRHVSGHPINVRHIMRCDTLQGLSKVGLFFKSDIQDDTNQ